MLNIQIKIRLHKSTCHTKYNETPKCGEQKNPLKLSKAYALKIANLKKKCMPGGQALQTAMYFFVNLDQCVQ